MNFDLRRDLADTIKWTHARGWAPGTGGNFSSKVSDDPFRLLMSPSGADKGTISPEDLLIIDKNLAVVEGSGNPSAESLLHVVIAMETNAKVILHTHTVWNTLCSLIGDDHLHLNGYEMLKGLSGIKTHDIEVSIPIFENNQDMNILGEQFRHCLSSESPVPAILIKGHGLYTWGCDIFEAKRHLEVLEFLFELDVRRRTLTNTYGHPAFS